MNTKYARWMTGCLLVLVVGFAGVLEVFGEGEAPALAQEQLPADLVTLNVDDGLISQVLNAFSRQTGRSIVVGPEVTGKVTARLSNVPWRDALDSILRPYGYGYYLVGETIIVTTLEKLPKVAPSVASGAKSGGGSSFAAPSRVLKVFTLKYLDAADVEAMIRSQLSPGGTVSRLVIQSQSWREPLITSDKTSTSTEDLGRLNRFSEKQEQTKGKTLVVVDTQDVIKQVEAVLAQLDKMPEQVQIEAKFVEVRANLLRDIGFEWGSGAGGASTPGVKTVGITEGGGLYAVGGQQINGGVTPAGFAAQSSGLNGAQPYNAGLALAFQKLTDFQFEMLIHLLEEDNSYNMLSSPRVMTMNNQDAVILVGQKLPIISSTIGAGDTPGTTKTTTELKRYEDIGIKLKVLPQVCDDNNINLIVHPSVRELLGYQSGSGIAALDSSLSGASYPIIAAREAETQVLVKSGQTIVIGGMIRDKKQNTQIRVPFLGSIPLLGVLFRRDTVNNEKIELLIFLTATVRNATEEKGINAPKTAAEGLGKSAMIEPKDVPAVDVKAP